MAGESGELAGEGEESPLGGGIIERLLAEPVTRQKQTGAAPVIDREREHAIEAQRQILAPLLPAMDEDLGIGVMRGKAVAAAYQPLTQLGMIVELAVEDDADLAVLVPHRLVAGGEIDDRQPAMTEEDMPQLVDIKAVAVRAAMRQSSGHPIQIDPAAPARESGQPAHPIRPRYRN